MNLNKNKNKTKFSFISYQIEKMEKTKKILIKKLRSEFYKGFWFLDYEKKDLKAFIDEIKNTKTKKQLDKITYNLFHN